MEVACAARKKDSKNKRADMTIFKSIPKELRELQQWVCVRGNSKVPMQAKCNRSASSSDSKTWADFNSAYNAIKSGKYDQLGFVFNNNGIVGIDIDCGYDDGLMSQTAADIIGKCASYTEKSRSGRGFHILVKGILPFKGKNNLAGVEIYQAARYFIMTGDTLLYSDITDNQPAIDYVLKKYFSTYLKSKRHCKYSDRIYSPKWPAPEGNKILLRPKYPEIQEGSRNICLTSIAGMMHTIGYSKKQILEELIRANEIACKPKLRADEVKAICNSISRYERG